MKRFRWHLLILAIVVAVILTMLFDHALRVRLIWGTSGFVLGFACGIALILRIQHRRKKKEAAVASAAKQELPPAERSGDGRPHRAGLFRHHK